MISPVKVWRNQKKIAKLMGARGKIISWTVIRVPPAEFSYQAPYAVAIVKLESGRSIVAQVVDCGLDKINFGDPVVTTIRRTSKPETGGVIPYGIKVKKI